MASALNDSDLIKKCIKSAIALEDRIAEDDKAGLWGFCFDLLILGKCKFLTEYQKKKLTEDLESRLERVSINCSPWVCESAGIRLATYYRSKSMGDEVTRVVDIVGNCFESACEGLVALQASA